MMVNFRRTKKIRLGSEKLEQADIETKGKLLIHSYLSQIIRSKPIKMKA